MKNNLTFKKAMKDLALAILFILWAVLATYLVLGLPIYAIRLVLDGNPIFACILLAVWVIVLTVPEYIYTHD